MNRTVERRQLRLLALGLPQEFREQMHFFRFLWGRANEFDHRHELFEFHDLLYRLNPARTSPGSPF